MNKPYIYYKKQCDYCVSKGKCRYEKSTRTFLERDINALEKFLSDVYGSLSFKCDYFVLDQLAYDIDISLQRRGRRELTMRHCSSCHYCTVDTKAMFLLGIYTHKCRLKNHIIAHPFFRGFKCHRYRRK